MFHWKRDVCSRHGASLALELLPIALLLIQVQAQTQRATICVKPGKNLDIEPHLGYFPGILNVTCSLSNRNSNTQLTKLLLRWSVEGKEKGGEQLGSSGSVNKEEATTEGYSGNLSSGVLSFIFQHPTCNDFNGARFECIIATQGGVDDLKTVASLSLKVASAGPMQVTPRPGVQIDREVGTDARMECSAVIGTSGVVFPVKVFWEWKKKDENQLDFMDIMTDPTNRKNPITNLKLDYVNCFGVNSTSILRIRLKPQDTKRTYRCAYSLAVSEARGDTTAPFVYKTAGFFLMGTVIDAREGIELELKTVYSQQSLVGMLAGIGSLFCVSLLAGCYAFRKTRGGKKYDTETAILDKEEAELDKLEADLGMNEQKDPNAETRDAETRDAEPPLSSEASDMTSDATDATTDKGMTSNEHQMVEG